MTWGPIGGGGGTSSATYTVTDALIVGTADTNGVRLDLESGVLACRKGDDSAYAPLAAFVYYTNGTSAYSCTLEPDRVRVASGGNGMQLTAGTANALVLCGLPGTNNGEGSMNLHVVGTASSALTSGASYTFTGALPDGAIILGVSARITTTVTGPTSVQVGDGTDPDRYGEFSTLTSGQTLTPADGTASPLEWRSATGDVVLTAVGGNFTAGAIRIVVYYIAFTAPTS